jgi:2-C-methyl-D-erythritol 2,4-cyclodiphosphate synthase
MELLRGKGYSLGNIDATVCLEQPKINPHVPEMQEVLAKVLHTDPENISIKATTNEKLGYVGREEGVTAYAVALICKN